MHISENERLEDLGLGGLRLIQDTTQFCFGVDAVLAAAFTRVKAGGSIIDFGCGNGIIPILLSHKTRAANIVGLEIQPVAADLARRNVELNGLLDRVSIRDGDLRTIREADFGMQFDAAVSNPPYMEPSRGEKNESEAMRIARHEIMCTVDDVVAAATRCVKYGSSLFMIHRPERIADIICSMRAHNMEPKNLRMVYPAPKKRATMVLIEGKIGARPSCIVHPPLYIQDDEGRYTDEIEEIYERNAAK